MAILFDLTSHKTEVLKFVLPGRTNKSIANKICIPQKTVEFQLDHIHAKIGARTRLMTLK